MRGHGTFRLLWIGALAWSACTGVVSSTGEDGGGAGGGGGGGGGATGGGAGAGNACDVSALLTAKCVSCHGAVPSQGAPMSLTSLASLRTASARDVNQTNAQRSLARLRDAVAPMPPVPLAPATAGELATLEAWISAGMPECSGGNPDAGEVAESSPNLIPQQELFACTAGLQSDAPTRLRRLNRWQWTRNVGGAVTRSWTGFSYFDNPLDPSAGEPYSSYATDESVDESTVEIFLPVLSEAGPTWAGPYAGSNRLERLQNDTSLRCMFNDAQPTASCVRHFLSEFLEHGVLFRKPRTDELARLHAFATTVLSQEEPGDAGLSAARTHSITRISNAAWLTTGALFREEFGDADAGRTTLTAAELSQQLAYAIGNRAPGAMPSWVWPTYSAPAEGHLADIAAAALDGGIFDDAQVDALFRKYAGGVDATRFDLVQDYGEDRRSRRGQYWLADGVAGFFREWLGYGNVAGIFKERPEATSAFDDGGTSPYRPQLSSYNNLMEGYYGSESTLVQQLDDAIARVVVGDTDVLKTLLTTRQFYLASTANPASYGGSVLWTGQIYGTEQAIADDQSARWITLPSSERAGVLTHPAWLAAHGGNFEDDPSAVHRGKWVREKLLCGWVPPLSSVRVQAMVGPHAADMSARRRLETATASAACQGCHALMNPLGMPFEIYNQAGYLRRADHAPDGGWGPPDGTVTLSGMPEPALDGPIRDAVDFSEKAAVSAHVKRCFVRQAFRYFMGRNENRSDACTLTRMEQAYDTNHGSFFSMVSALMTSDTWKTRRVPGEGE
ncbi:MAG: DUF1588 domain-containing protein [Myxococcota bacterium]